MPLPIAFLQNLNAPEIIMIFAVVLLFFGAKRLPELFRSFGKSMREFKRATQGIEDDIRTAMDAPDEEETKEVAKVSKPNGTSERSDDDTPKKVKATTSESASVEAPEPETTRKES